MPPAVIHAVDLDKTTMDQINAIADHPLFSSIHMMPDAHAGAGCPIGFTGYCRGGVVPNVVGVDISCGVVMSFIKRAPNSYIWDTPDVRNALLSDFDRYVRSKVPLGMNSRTSDEQIFVFMDKCEDSIVRTPWTLMEEVEEFYKANNFSRFIKPILQVGTLGGGNHFLEIVESKEGEMTDLAIVVHSGSRNFGKQVADFYQKIANESCKDLVPDGLKYLKEDTPAYDDYIHYMEVAGRYAHLNRIAILKLAMGFFGYEHGHVIESVHNYMDTRTDLIRKGAISAQKDEEVLIPLNMSEGVILGVGKGKGDYNFSAPHGAGRKHGRGEMRRLLDSGKHTMEEYRDTMEGIFSTSVSEATIDESPMAYKDVKDILPFIEETVEIQETLRPVYNLKAEELSHKEQKKLRKEKQARIAAGLDVSETQS